MLKKSGAINMLFTGNFSQMGLEKAKKRFYWAGGIMLVVGFISLAAPMLASIAVETLCGFILLAVALANGAAAFSAVRTGGSPWQSGFMAVISFAAGFIFLVHPLAGVMTLSLLLSAYFLIDGITRIVEYFRLRSIGGSMWILLSGILSVLLAFMMWQNYFTGASMIGIVLGINLIFGGVSLIMLGRGCSDASHNVK